MTDARMPERWLIDRRLLRLSDPAFRLFVSGLMFSVTNRTDGVVDDGDLPLIPATDASRVVELAKSGLWVRDRDTWVIVDFDSTQTSRDELQVLENARRREREKKQRQRANKAAKELADSASTGDVPGDSPSGSVPGTAQEGRKAGRQGPSPRASDNGHDPSADVEWPEVAR